MQASQTSDLPCACFWLLGPCGGGSIKGTLRRVALEPIHGGLKMIMPYH